MAQYTSRPVTLAISAEKLAERVKDFSLLGEYIEKLPAEERAKVGDVSFTTDSITISTPQAGKITLEAVERTPSRLVMEAKGSPVPMSLAVNITPVDADSCNIVSVMDVEIPAILRPMVGGMMQKAVDQMADMFKRFE